MSQLMFLLMNVFNSATFFVMKHPMSMGMSLLIQTVFICLLTNTLSQSAWFSYILFLVFLGGMLVLFIYMTSVASNELFLKNNLLSFIMLMAVMGVVAMMMMITDPMLLTTNSEEMSQLQKSEGPSSLASSMFNYPNNMLTTMMVLYLFLTLIVVVKITEVHQGPLRAKD